MVLAHAAVVRAQALDDAVPERANVQDVIRYEVRVGDDPSRIARMFGVPTAELLERNGIADPRGLRVGSVLEIPDPRAATVARLRAQGDRRERELTGLRDRIAAQQARLDDLEGDLSRVAAERDSLAGRLGRQRLLEVATVVLLVLLLGTAGALAVAVGWGRDAASRRCAALKEIDAFRATVDKYRALGGQLELKYHNLFRSGAAPGEGAEALRREYDEERAELEARIEESERRLAEIEGEPERRRRRQHRAA